MLSNSPALTRRLVTAMSSLLGVGRRWVIVHEDHRRGGSGDRVLEDFAGLDDAGVEGATRDLAFLYQPILRIEQQYAEFFAVEQPHVFANRRGGVLRRAYRVLFVPRVTAESSSQFECGFELDRLGFPDAFDFRNLLDGRTGKRRERAKLH